MGFKWAALLSLSLAACEGPEVVSGAIPSTGSVQQDAATLTWTQGQEALQFQLSYVAPSKCYRAGPLTSQLTDDNRVEITAEVTHLDGVCAQVLTTVTFEGEVAGAMGAKSLSAVITDQRSGRQIRLTLDGAQSE